MPQDYRPCGRCGKTMESFNHMVYPVTWMGRPVCGDCAAELRKKDSNRPDILRG